MTDGGWLAIGATVVAAAGFAAGWTAATVRRARHHRRYAVTLNVRSEDPPDAL